MSLTQKDKNINWYSLNKTEFLQNKKDDYTNYYKYYYKIRMLLKKYPEIIIPIEIINMKISNKNEDYKTKYLLIKNIIDTHIIKKIEKNIVETPNGGRRKYKQQTNIN